jgi:hypothetical protein
MGNGTHALLVLHQIQPRTSKIDLRSGALARLGIHEFVAFYVLRNSYRSVIRQFIEFSSLQESSLTELLTSKMSVANAG